MNLPAHASHSAINSHLRCGKAFELEKIKNYPTMPAWWLIGGSAVHSVTEAIDTGDIWADVWQMAEDCLYDEIQKALNIESDDSKWLAAGYGRSQQRFEHWNQKVKNYAEQWAGQFDPGYWSEVELDVSMILPSGIEVKGFVDRVRFDIRKNLVSIVDLKSGSTRPDSDQQLGIYAVLTAEWFKRDTKYTRNVFKDVYISAENYMFKDDTFYQMDVSHWNLKTLDKLVQGWYRGIEASVFLPNRGAQCGRCSVASACYLQSGDTETTREFDSLNPNYEGR